ncbi:MAG TPA: DUF72 domain-containing protein [Gemmatimonadales bacterium]|nr:DUF72 domain-containing protein [Gemmatimonadales bacterium]
MNVRVGTSGYNYPAWKGTFYPARLATSQMLEYYAQRLSTVEINYTFYRMPNAKIVTGWDAATPDGFTFVLKAPQRITHIARLRDIDDPLRFFLETARKLGAKLGPILFQLPPNFKKDLDRLNDLLTQFPADLRCAWEFRHESWLVDEVYEALRVANAALCLADTEEKHPRLVATADWGYLRLRDEGYEKKDLEQWTSTVRDLGKGWQDAYIFFKHEESGIGPRLAQEFVELLAAP